MALIRVPEGAVRNVTDSMFGVVFKEGVASTDNPDAVRYFQDLGFEVSVESTDAMNVRIAIAQTTPLKGYLNPRLQVVDVVMEGSTADQMLAATSGWQALSDAEASTLGLDLEQFRHADVLGGRPFGRIPNVKVFKAES